MATATLLPLADYLLTTYRPDREYIEGELVDRHMGKREHARLQALLTIWLGNHEQDW